MDDCQHLYERLNVVLRLSTCFLSKFPPKLKLLVLRECGSKLQLRSLCARATRLTHGAVVAGIEETFIGGHQIAIRGQRPANTLIGSPFSRWSRLRFQSNVSPA